MKEKILEKNIKKSSATIKIMDEFDALDNRHKRLYDMLKLNNVFYVKYRKKLFKVSLFIKRLPYGKENIDSSLNFTDLKSLLLGRLFTIEDRKSYKVLNEVFTEIKTIWNKTEQTSFCEFQTPVKFNAQNSSNRTGYGNIYCGETLIHEGTPYGETTNYMFVGVEFRRM